MHKKPTLTAAMTPFPYALDINASVREAATLMEKHNIHHLPVTEGDSIIGIVTARDVSHRSPEDTVRTCYTAHPYVTEITTPLDEVLWQMAERKIGCVIVTRYEKLAGIFTHVDACRTFAGHLRIVFPTPPEDIVA